MCFAFLQPAAATRRRADLLAIMPEWRTQYGETGEICASKARAAIHVVVDASLVKLLCGCGVAPSMGHVEKEGQPSQLLLPNHRRGGCRAPAPGPA
jgi:hypothetical protein